MSVAFCVGYTTDMPTLIERIYRAFGGPRQLWKALRTIDPTIDPATVYRWSYPPERRGTGGRIPPDRLRAIVALADVRGLDLQLTVADLL